MNQKHNLLLLFIAASTVPGISHSTVYEFNFTGRLTVLNGDGEIVSDRDSAGIFDPYGAQIPIASTLTYDDNFGSGSLGLTITPFGYFGSSETIIHDISFQNLSGNLLVGNMLVDWAYSTDIELTTVWDASGLFNAINYTPGGLQAGDIISGNTLLRDGNILDNNIGSATPATDGLIIGGSGSYAINQGPAPIAMTTWNYTDGSLYDDGIAGSPLTGGPFPGFNINLDIGSGNSLTVTSVSSVPIPAAIWLFGSGLLSLIGISNLTRRSA